ncbi:Lead, cadmium, zinc and mercury transporting ATPase [Enhygromyxa salina]|uniref:Lead, cadmium, zinc and mercury transporting ATPase n=1 Tax=Enhygromyxa salina TaxID=215803 RepID=A0A0C2D1L2_9BACT|nr:Lead, cadmium, zinc and mercury transporting ATPase [Enhygromyxa salina]
MLVEIDHRPVALLALADTIRPDAHAAIERLRALGLRVAIRSGDHPAAVAAVARELGIQDFAGAMTPEQKARSLERLRQVSVPDEDPLFGVNVQALSGSRISADRPVAVFGGHTCANVPDEDLNTCDHIEEQIISNCDTSAATLRGLRYTWNDAQIRAHPRGSIHIPASLLAGV